MYKLVVGGDICVDNGIFNWGEYDSIESAIAEYYNIYMAEFYGCEVFDENNNLVAACYGLWNGPKYWHCPL